MHRRFSLCERLETNIRSIAENSVDADVAKMKSFNRIVYSPHSNSKTRGVREFDKFDGYCVSRRMQGSRGMLPGGGEQLLNSDALNLAIGGEQRDRYA